MVSSPFPIDPARRAGYRNHNYRERSGLHMEARENDGLAGNKWKKRTKWNKERPGLVL